jgi:putative phosphoesterase
MARSSRSSAVSSSARLTTASASFALRPDGCARIVAVADTHSLPHADSARRLRDLAPDAILHAGDIGDLGVLADLEKIAPVFAVRGNIDTRAPGLPDVLTVDLVRDGAMMARLLLLHIAVAGPRLRADAIKLAEEAQASLIVCGHSHVPFIAQQRGLTVFNPGSIGPRRFMLPIVFGSIDIQPTGIQLAHINVETGLPWSPP